MKQGKQCRYKHNIKKHSCNHCCSGKTKSITCCVCVCVCVCSLSYAACNAHGTYCHLWHAPLYKIFPHYLINGTIFGRKKKLLIIKCVFWFHPQLLSETFLILRRSERDMIKMYIGLYVKYRYCQISTKLEFSRQIPEKYSITKFHEDPSSGSRADQCGQTWRR